MGGPGRHPGALAKVPRMLRGVRCDWDWSRAFAVDRDIPADAACDPVHGVVGIPCSKTHAQLHRVDTCKEKSGLVNRFERTLGYEVAG
jgi:hypothetical protein